MVNLTKTWSPQQIFNLLVPTLPRKSRDFTGPMPKALYPDYCIVHCIVGLLFIFGQCTRYLWVGFNGFFLTGCICFLGPFEVNLDPLATGGLIPDLRGSSTGACGAGLHDLELTNGKVWSRRPCTVTFTLLSCSVAGLPKNTLLLAYSPSQIYDILPSWPSGIAGRGKCRTQHYAVWIQHHAAKAGVLCWR